MGKNNWVILFAIAFLYCSSIPLYAYASEQFRLAGTKYQKQSININTNSDTIFSFPKSSQPLYGFAVDMSIMKTAPDFFVRIVLEDTKGGKYVVAESYASICDMKRLDLSNYCEETVLLDGVIPKYLHFYVKGANICVSSFSSTHTRMYSKSELNYDSIRESQLKAIVARINSYNKKHKKLWAAGVTPISRRRFTDKMRLLGIPESEPTEGIEYYVGGIFEMGQAENILRDSPYYVSEFDWRDRHGKNWISPLKSQGESGYCAAFAAVGSLEALVNIYNNHLYNMDLSEQEAACCNGDTSPYTGMSPTAPISYLMSNGVCDETAYPFVDDPSFAYCRSDEVTPNSKVKIGNYHYVSGSWDGVKDALIHYGPLSSGYWRASGGHSMTLVGYKTLQVGDTVRIMEDGSNYYTYIVEPDDSRIGLTYWVFKNSYADVSASFPMRYFPILFYQRSNMIGPYALENPLVVFHPTAIEQICEDADGDGFYYWGMGSKPESCPSWVPDEPDGNDSDYLYGPMDQYGNLTSLAENASDSLVVVGNELFDTYGFQYSNIVIDNGARLTISGTTILYPLCKIIINGGGELVIDGGNLYNANIVMSYNSRLTLLNGGTVFMKQGVDFCVPTGAIAEISHGNVL